jgi:nickel-dependent lactate racemase
VKQFDFKFSKGTVQFEIPEKNFYKELQPYPVTIDLMGVEEVERSLREPINSPKLKEIVKAGEKVVIVTSDITRPVPSYKILPSVLNELKRGGIEEEDVTLVLALGSHRKHTEEEKIALVGEGIYNSKVKILDSDMENCINLGQCAHGTPVDIFEPVVKSDRIICIGNIEYHYFAGYSGGAKALMPGVSSHAAIQANHSNMVKPESRTGNLETNPVRQDIDQITEFIHIDFIVNVVLNAKKEIIKAVSGHWKDAHREGCAFLDSIYGIEIEEAADIVMVTPGGFPKDINLYQSQKSLDNSKHAVKQGGVIILVASAKEGFGEKTFEEWMIHKSPSEMITEIKDNFVLGGHKAAAIASVIQKADVYFVSDLEDDLVRRIGFIPFRTVQEAVNEALEKQGSESKVLLMPAGGSTLPIVKVKI